MLERAWYVAYSADILRKTVSPRSAVLHLVEGHTRVGALAGFLKNVHDPAPVTLAETHLCWIGRPGRPQPIADWRAVRRVYPLSFLSWLCEDSQGGRMRAPCAESLMSALDDARADGSNLSALLAVAKTMPNAAEVVRQLHDVHTQWRVEFEQDG